MSTNVTADGLEMGHVTRHRENFKRLQMDVYAAKWAVLKTIWSRTFRKLMLLLLLRRPTVLVFTSSLKMLQLWVRTAEKSAASCSTAAHIFPTCMLYVIWCAKASVNAPFIIYNFSFLGDLIDSLPIESKLESASVAWNTLTPANSSKLENIQNGFSNLGWLRIYLISGRRQLTMDEPSWRLGLG